MTGLQMDGHRHTCKTIRGADMMTLRQTRLDNEVTGPATGVLSIDPEMHLLFSPPCRQLDLLIQIMGD
jgi:hypothetical protein